MVTCGPRPAVSTFVRYGINPYAQYLYGVYTLLHRIAGLGAGEFFPAPVASQKPLLERAYGALPSHRESDGIVPTLSQVWGEVIHAARADHLDVVGHFGARRPGRVDSDWLPSNSGFDQAAFNSLWASVAAFVTSEARLEKSGQPATGTVRTDLDVTEASHRAG